MKYELPELGYAFDALEPHIDARTMEIHYTKHHQTYIDKLNEALDGHSLAETNIVELMQKLESVPEEIRMKVRNHGGGHANHTFFWKLLTPSSGSNKLSEGSLHSAIVSQYSSIEKFQEEFSNKALAHFGSGWVWLVPNEGKLDIVTTPNQDTPLMEGKFAILGLDIWEHAYYLKYQNKRGEYISAFWNVVNWNKVEKYFEEIKP